MADWEDVRRLALALPETSEGRSRGQRSWDVRSRTFVWERPLRDRDVRDLGDAAPEGPILGVRCEHLVAKEALLASEPEVVFATPHFDGYPAVLVQLEHVAVALLEELVVEAWLARAPKRLAAAHLAERG